MDEAEFKRRAARLEQIAKVLDKLPPEVRGAAFALLEDYAVGTTEDPAPSRVQKKTPAASAHRLPVGASREQFFAAFDHDKPSDNVRLIAAFHYREFGIEPFAVDEVTQIASDVGITIPDRVDMTLVSATENGKKLFTRAGTGMFKVTVHGEAFLKATYSVTKGTKKRVVAAE